MKKIAIIINGDLSLNRQGQINSAINRIKYLKELDCFEIDAYCIQEYEWGLLRWIHHQNRIDKTPLKVVDEIVFRVFYKKSILLDSFFESSLKLPPVFSSYWIYRIARLFRGYDLVVGHSTVGGLVAFNIYKTLSIPFCVIWHGSDIHTNPVSNKYIKRITHQIINNSFGNVFVSLSLLNTAIKVFGDIPVPYLAYNAPGEQFVKYSEEHKTSLRVKNNVRGKKVIAFIGNLVPVKNVFSLPNIFKQVALQNNNVAFWVVGDGVHRVALENRMKDNGLECRFWGNLQPEEMPDIMNTIDVIVLPSFNESFGMVLVEAISCGANAVGSNRGGIPEVIGKENCFELNESFEVRIANRISYMLHNHVDQWVNQDFDWRRTALSESSLFSDILHRKDI